MKPDLAMSAYQRLRKEPLWALLAADNGPVILALLKTHLYDGERLVPASTLIERLGHDLEELQRRGEAWPQPANAYLAAWLKLGWLKRSFPADAAEEQYELSTAAAQAVAFVSGLTEPRSRATESRLAAVIQQLAQLAEATNPDPRSRVEALMRERNRIDAEIAAVQAGTSKILAEDRALERVREVIDLAKELTGDFWRVRDEFERLNRTLRERLIDDEGHRGAILEELFAGVDVISQSDAGRTFAAFWRLLTDLEQKATLEDAVGQILTRPFAQHLARPERRFLTRLTRALLGEATSVHDVLGDFARSLKSFVQSRAFHEQRRLNGLLKEALRGALALKNTVQPFAPLSYTLELTSGEIRSISQHVLHDPDLQAGDATMQVAAPLRIDLETVGDLVARSEIDFRTLKANVRAVLRDRTQASIAEVMEIYPAHQGLGSVIGYVALGSRHGIRGAHDESVSWVGEDEQARSAIIPTLYFIQERSHAFN